MYSGTAPIEAHEEARSRRQGRRRSAPDLRRGRRPREGRPGARAPRRRSAASRGCSRSEANLRKLERDYKRSVELSARRDSSPRAPPRTPSSISTRCARLRPRSLELSYTEIRAPIAGVVSARHIKLGNTIKRERPDLPVTDLDPLIAYVHVPEKEFREARARTGGGIVVRRARRHELHRHDRAHLPDGRSADRHVPRARSKSPIRSGELKPGMFARVDIVYERRENALQLPRNAILDADGEQSVFVVATARPSSAASRTGPDQRRLDRGHRGSQGRRTASSSSARPASRAARPSSVVDRSPSARRRRSQAPRRADRRRGTAPRRGIMHAS